MATKPTIHAGPPNDLTLAQAVREQMEEGEIDFGFEGSWNGRVTLTASLKGHPTEDKTGWFCVVRTGDGQESTVVFSNEEAEVKILEAALAINEEFRKRQRKPN